MRRLISKSEDDEVVNRQFKAASRLHLSLDRRDDHKPGAGLARAILILAGLALCYYASQLARGRVSSAKGDTVVVSADSSSSDSASSSSSSSPRRAVQRPGAEFTLVDWQFHAVRAHVMRFVAQIRPGSEISSLSGELRSVDDQGREQRRALADVAFFAPSHWSADPREQSRNLLDEAERLCAWLDEPLKGAAEATRSRRSGDDAAQGLIELTDGQRWPGKPAADQPPGSDSIVWLSAQLGLRTVPLDQIRRIRLPGTFTNRASDIEVGSASKDRVVLGNGDVVEGFIESLGTEADRGRDEQARMQVVVDLGDHKKTTIELSSVAQIELSNPVEKRQGMEVWFEDGTLARVMRIAFAAEEGLFEIEPMTIAPAKPQDERDVKMSSDEGRGARAMSVPAKNLRAIVLDSSRLAALSDMKIVSQAPSPDRRWTMSARTGSSLRGMAGMGAEILDLDPIVLPGPMKVEWAMPSKAQWFSTTAVLPPSAFVWGDCQVVVSVTGQRDVTEHQIASVRLSAANPVATINAALPTDEKSESAEGIRLRLEVLSGQSGPIQDQVVLFHACVIRQP